MLLYLCGGVREFAGWPVELTAGGEDRLTTCVGGPYNRASWCLAVVSRACKLNLLDMVEFYCRCLFGFFGAGGDDDGNVFIRAFVYV